MKIHDYKITINDNSNSIMTIQIIQYLQTIIQFSANPKNHKHKNKSAIKENKHKTSMIPHIPCLLVEHLPVDEVFEIHHDHLFPPWIHGQGLEGARSGGGWVLRGCVWVDGSGSCRVLKGGLNGF